jgi:hypothetical protein
MLSLQSRFDALPSLTTEWFTHLHLYFLDVFHC